MNSAPAQAASISPRALASLRAAGTACELLDVRTAPEYATAHVDGAVLVPLDQLDPAAYLARRREADAPLYVLCQAGGRAAKAIEKFRAAGFDGAVLVEGGTQGWIDAGLPVERGTSRVLPLMRQVQLIIGVVSATGAGLAMAVDPRFAILPLITGSGLIIAGSTGWCGLALLLAKAPWNRSSSAPAASCSR